MTSELSITIKYTGPNGKGYDEPWAVFRGESQYEIAAQIGMYFGMELTQYEGVPLHQVVLLANEYAHGVRALSDVLGAQIVKNEGWGNNEPSSDDWTRDVKDADTGSGEDEDDDEHPYANLLAAIEEATDRETLKRLWATNRDAFKDHTVEQAWKAKGKSLAA